MMLEYLMTPSDSFVCILNKFIIHNEPWYILDLNTRCSAYKVNILIRLLELVHNWSSKSKNYNFK